MKVLSVIIGTPLRKVSGATNAGRALSVATAEQVDLELAIMWDADGYDRIDNLPVRYVKATTPFGPLEKRLPRQMLTPLYRSNIPDLIRDGDYDLVHIHNLIPAFAAEAVANACQEKGVPYVISSHGFNEQSRYAEISSFGFPKNLLAEFAITAPFRRIVKDAAAIFALSDCEFEMLAELGISRDRIHVVTNGINEFFLNQPSASELDAVRTKFHLGSEPMLFFMGSLHGYKGVDVFLDALHDITPPFQAVIAGQFKDDSERIALLDKAAIAHDDPRVTFTGRVSDEELRALHHLSDLFVYPTRGDTLPLVVLEAMACGSPVVSTTVGGIPFEVTPDTGVLVPPGDAAAVASAVNSLLSDPALCDAMGRAGRNRVETVFRWHLAAQAAVEGYERVLAPSRKLAQALSELSLTPRH